MAISHGTATRAPRIPFWRRLSWRVGASLLLLAGASILASGLLQYRAQETWLRESLGALLLNIARTGSLAVDGDAHERMVAAGRQDTAEYAGLRERLLLIQEVNGLGDAVYTLTAVNNGAARFGAIGNGLAGVGSEYRLAPGVAALAERAFRDGVAVKSDVYSGPDGRWITAYAPIKTGAQRTVAVLGVDFRADVYLRELAVVRRRLYLHAALAAALALGAGILLARRISRPVVQLADLARAVVRGELTARARISRRDEIGMLGNVLYLMVDRLQVSHRSMTDVLVRALEVRDGAPGSLSRLGAAARALGERLELSPAQQEALELGALVHDIGELRTPDAILKSRAPLTMEERAEVERHPAAGAEILERVPLLTPALDVVGAHHERYDGGGYPRGLRGEAIPWTARIFAVVDAVDAMVHDRPHRRAYSVAEALAELAAGSGKQFDPRVVEAALEMPAEGWATLLAVTLEAPAAA